MKKLCKSFGYALLGIGHALRTERNFRIHLAAGGAALWLGRFFSLRPGDWALLWLCIGLVLGAELFNTAIERTVDLIIQEPHPLAAFAKDAAAGGVLVCALSAAGVGFFLFRDVSGWLALLGWLEELFLNPFGLLVAIGVVIGALYLVFIVGETSHRIKEK